MSSEEMKGKPLEYTAQLFLKECQMTADQVKRVEIETRGQSTNDLWHQQRIGRVTASNFHTYPRLLPNGRPVARGAQGKSMGDQISVQGARAGA